MNIGIRGCFLPRDTAYVYAESYCPPVPLSIRQTGRGAVVGVEILMGLPWLWACDGFGDCDESSMGVWNDIRLIGSVINMR